VIAKPSEISALIAAVQLNNVRLIEASAKTTIRSPKEVGEAAKCSIETSAQVKDILQNPASFYVVASMRLQLAGNKAESEPAVSVQASVELEYLLPEGFPVRPKELNDFAEINAVFNAWPYWREYIQNAFSRMNLPPFTLPVYRLKDRMLGANKQRSLPRARKIRSKTG
jgi:hypothetical protein